jgi:hypothetical protein
MTNLVDCDITGIISACRELAKQDLIIDVARMKQAFAWGEQCAQLRAIGMSQREISSKLKETGIERSAATIGEYLYVRDHWDAMLAEFGEETEKIGYRRAVKFVKEQQKLLEYKPIDDGWVEGPALTWSKGKCRIVHEQDQHGPIYCGYIGENQQTAGDTLQVVKSFLDGKMKILAEQKAIAPEPPAEPPIFKHSAAAQEPEEAKIDPPEDDWEHDGKAQAHYAASGEERDEPVTRPELTGDDFDQGRLFQKLKKEIGTPGVAEKFGVPYQYVRQRLKIASRATATEERRYKAGKLTLQQITARIDKRDQGEPCPELEDDEPAKIGDDTLAEIEAALATLNKAQLVRLQALVAEALGRVA